MDGKEIKSIGTSGGSVVSIYRSFDDCVREIMENESRLKTITPRKISGGLGKPIETFVLDYSEILAEIRRLLLIKRMYEKKKKI